MTGTVFDIQRFCVHDGPGIRTTVFLKGCPLRCGWCHNPEGLTMEPQVLYHQEACIGCLRCGGSRTVKTAASCPSGALKVSGSDWEPKRLLGEVLADRDFYGDDGGVTFSGGECLLQADFVAEMLRLIKAQGITTAVDTCGFVPWKNIEKTLGLCDTYLYDIKLANPAKHKRYTGQDNGLILDNLQNLSWAGARLWIRVPVIPDVNDDPEEMGKIVDIAASTRGVEKVTLMPYHTLGISKYRTLGMVPGYETDKMISKTKLESLKAIFRDRNIPTD